ncbi:hypothetical protein [uncultured Bacteroides sp.]|uniref:hypothetical protein n=1 Tax=uncultured Bacteroides sp. TaxID=162156 RepID=UPI00261DC64D|nr:hypothetical protein [uncultured Bacteroides sp.]
MNELLRNWNIFRLIRLLSGAGFAIRYLLRRPFSHNSWIAVGIHDCHKPVMLLLWKWMRNKPKDKAYI